VYTPELIKSVYARTFYRKRTFTSISSELNLSLDQVKKAYTRGRVIGLVNEKWVSYVPELVYEAQVKAPRVYEPRNEQEAKWPDELVLWVIAQTKFHQRSAYDIGNVIANKQLKAPSTITVQGWANGRTKQSRRLLPIVIPEHANFYEFSITVDLDPLPTSLVHRLKTSVANDAQREKVRKEGRKMLAILKLKKEIELAEARLKFYESKLDK
jgi:hypothetical protein